MHASRAASSLGNSNDPFDNERVIYKLGTQGLLEAPHRGREKKRSGRRESMLGIFRGNLNRHRNLNQDFGAATGAAVDDHLSVE